ncbi:hypothetical protein ACWD01_36930 [Streptomyces sp. NPDC002835]
MRQPAVNFLDAVAAALGEDIAGGSEDGTAAWQLGIFSPWPQLRRTPAP